MTAAIDANQRQFSKRRPIWRTFDDMSAMGDIVSDFEIIITKFQLALSIRDHARVADIPKVMERNF